MLILDSQPANTLFHSPISKKAQHIIDLESGNGDSALKLRIDMQRVSKRIIYLC